MRVGLGTDRHRLEPGLPLVIGGHQLPEAPVGCVAHSDGDVLLHALTDALLGAIAAGDIGELFPDTDPRWAGAASELFVKEALRLAREAGWTLANLDATVHLQHVKLRDHKAAIRSSLARLTGLDQGAVGLKAKTGESVGPVGRGEAIDALVVVLLTRSEP